MDNVDNSVNNLKYKGLGMWKMDWEIIFGYQCGNCGKRAKAIEATGNMVWKTM